MELLVLSWLILQSTDSYFLLGLVLVFNNLPRPLISLISGVIADRFSRHRIIFISQVVNALTSGAMLFMVAFHMESLSEWMVFAAIFMQGATKAIEDPSRRTAILDIVGEGRLVPALSLDTISNTTGKMVGPILGGWLLANVGISGEFTGAYIFVVSLHVINLGVVTQLRIPRSMSSGSSESVLRGLRTSIGFAIRSRTLLGLLYITIVMNTLAFPVQQFIPAIGRDHLNVGVALVGILVAAEGIGQLAGAALIALKRNVRYHGRIFALGSVSICVITFIWVWSPWYGVTFSLLAIGGIGQSGFGTMQSAVTLLASPPELRGRMMGLLSFCIGVGTPIGGLEMGVIATVFSIQGAISANVAAGLLFMVPALIWTPLLWKPLSQPPRASAEANLP
jgi:MFS family permease